MLSYQTIPVGMIQSNSYVLKDEATGGLALIDCGGYVKTLREGIEAAGGDVRYILITHGHFDHIQGVAAAKEAHPGAQVAISAIDAPYLRGDKETIPSRPMKNKRPVEPDLLLRDGDVIPLGARTLQVVETPGHTTGGVCFWAEEAGLLFTGDTLFFEEVGRDDLPGGDGVALAQSIHRLYELGEATVLPGHGPPSSLAHERLHNPYVTA